MALPKKLAGAFAATALVAAFAVPGVASAAHAGEKGFTEIYPRASQVCTTVAHGGGSKRLRANAAAVLADCAALENGFNSARASVLATDAALTAARVNDVALRRAACKTTPAHPVSCAHAWARTHRALARLSRQRIAAAETYWRLLEVNRRVFWHSLHLLPGGKDLHEDSPIPQLTS